MWSRIAAAWGFASFLTLWAVGTGPVLAGPKILVIAHDPAFAQALDRPALARIYRRWQRIDTAGRPLVPVNLPATAPLRRAFSQVLFQQPPEAMADFWDEQYFQGISPPAVQASPAALLRFVQRTPGAVGYLPDCLEPAGVVVAMRLDWPPGVDPAGVCAAQTDGPIRPYDSCRRTLQDPDSCRHGSGRTEEKTFNNSDL